MAYFVLIGYKYRSCSKLAGRLVLNINGVVYTGVRRVANCSFSSVYVSKQDIILHSA